MDARRKKSSIVEKALPVAAWALPAIFLALFFFYPLAGLSAFAFQRAAPGAFPLAGLFTSTVGRVLGFTFYQAALSTLLTLAVGLPGAYLFARFRFPGKSLLQALAAVPFVMPTLVVAAAFNALLGSNGWLNLALETAAGWIGLPSPVFSLENSLTAILLAHVFYNTTIVLRIVGDFWGRLDVRLVQAARTLGATPWGAFRQVTLPLLSPAIAAAALLVFIFDFTSFGVILVLGGPRFATLEVEIYYQAIALFNLPQAAALSLLQLACTLALTIVYSRLSQRLSRPLSLRPPAQVQQPLNTPRRRLFAFTVNGLLVILLTLPLLALAVRSVVQVDSGSARPALGESVPAPGFTLAYYRHLFTEERRSVFYAAPGRAIQVSLAYGGMTVVLALLLGLPAAWALANLKDDPLTRFFDPVLMLPMGASAVTLGLGFILTLGNPPLDLRTSPLLPPLAHTLAAFPFVVRSLTPAMRSIRPRLRQAAAVLGASPAAVIRQVDLPLAGRALLVAAAFAFTISLGEFGATALIARPEYPTIPILIYRYLSQPGALNYGAAIAMSTLLMIVCAGSLIAIERFRVNESEF
jgi:thiamine transport system permease protein